MSTLLHISDTHLGTEWPAVSEALIRLAAQLKPALVVLSGDVTQRARRCQFVAAKRLLERLGFPYLVIPGNHDVPLFNPFARLFAPYARFIRTFGEALEPQWQSADWLVIGVNTTRPWRHRHGQLSGAQVDQVAARLRQSDPLQCRVVVTHQPMLVTRPSDAVNLLRGHAHAAAVWAQAGADFVLGGHIHLPYRRPLRELQPTLARDVWVVQAGTAISSRVRGGIPNSVNVLRYPSPQGNCRLERWDYREDLDTFAMVETHVQALDRGAARASAYSPGIHPGDGTG